MKDYGKQRGSAQPQPIEVTANSIFVASNIQPYTENIDGYEMSGYEYDYKEYSKDEYIAILINKTNELENELSAAKIVLGVE